jgi:hypothetical protein
MSHYTAAQRNGESWAQPRPQHVTKPARYQTNLYRDPDTGRERWAVLETSTRVWYFPENYGMRAAVALCNRLSRNAG